MSTPSSEMTNLIYDALMQNVDTAHPPFNLSLVENQTCYAAHADKITFDYDGEPFQIIIQKMPKED